MAFSMSQPLPGSTEFRMNHGAAPDGARVYLFRVLSATGAQDIRRYAGVSFRVPYLRSVLLKSISRAANPAGSGGTPVFAVFENGRQILATPGWTGHAESRSSLAPRLPLWEVAGAYSGTTVDDLAREQFRRNLLISLLALAALGVAAFATFTMATRETRLAHMKAAFVSNVSHEMKTPLALISMYAETLDTGRISSPERVREYYRTILRESRRLALMVENVLDFARIESGHASWRFERVDLGEVAADAVSRFEDQLRAGGFRLSVEIEPDLPPIEGDRAALAQALLNLIDNAAKYSGDANEIRIKVRRTGTEVTVDVTDKGIGIDSFEQQKIFEEFYRAGNPITQRVRGAGLGLALVQRIVDAHCGRVELHSTPGQGSTFSLVLAGHHGDNPDR